MSYVIYKPQTWRIYKHPNGKEAIYETERTAQQQFTKLVNAGVLSRDAWKVESYTVYSETEPMVTVQNLMSGKDTLIRMSERGGCCDPSTERYWTM